MTVRVMLFAAARQLAGTDVIELDLPESATVAQLRTRLVEAVPELARLMDQALFSVDAEYADDATKIALGAEVACIPPVSGG